MFVLALRLKLPNGNGEPNADSSTITQLFPPTQLSGSAAALLYFMENGIEEFWMDFQRIQIKPPVSVEELQRFFKRADVSGLRRKFYALSVLIPKACRRASVSSLSARYRQSSPCSSTTYKRERAAFGPDFDYDFRRIVEVLLSRIFDMNNPCYSRIVLLSGPVPLVTPNGVVQNLPL